MPGSLLSPHDALSDRSDASYGSTDSKTSGKKVSFNRAVRVKQYPWPPDEENHHGSGNDHPHFSLPSRRFWFKVYKTKSPENSSEADRNRHIADVTWDGEEYLESMHDTLTPIAEDEGFDYLDCDSHRSVHYEDVKRNSVKNIVSKFQSEIENHPRHENGIYENGSLNHYASEPPVDYISQFSAISNPKWNGVVSSVKTVLSKGHSRLKADKNKNAEKDCLLYHGNTSSEDPYSTRYSTAPSAGMNENYSASEKSVMDKSISISGSNGAFPVKIPRAESPRRSMDGNPKFSTRYKANDRRSRSSDNRLNNNRRYEECGKSANKAVSTEDLLVSERENEMGPAWLYKASKDKSTQCNGTLRKSRNGSLLVFGTPKLSRSTFHSNTNGAIAHHCPNGARQSTSRGRVQMNISSNEESSGSMQNSGNGISRFDRGRSSNRILSSSRKGSNEFHGNGPPVQAASRTEKLRRRDPQILKGPPAYGIAENATQDDGGRFNIKFCDDNTTANKLLSSANDHANCPFQELPRSHQLWKSSPVADRRERIRPRDAFPTSATVGYHIGRQKTFQRFAAEDRYANGTETSYRMNEPLISKLERPRNPFSHAVRGTTECEANKNSLMKPTNESRDKTERLDDTQPIIDWTQSGFQLGRRLDSGLGSANSDSEYVVHRRSPLLMYIPGVSHHDRPAVEEDRMSGLSCMSRSEVEDDVGPLVNMSKGPMDIQRRHSMPKDGKKSWVKWKVNGKSDRHT